MFLSVSARVSPRKQTACSNRNNLKWAVYKVEGKFVFLGIRNFLSSSRLLHRFLFFICWERVTVSSRGRTVVLKVSFLFLSTLFLAVELYRRFWGSRHVCFGFSQRRVLPLEPPRETPPSWLSSFARYMCIFGWGQFNPSMSGRIFLSIHLKLYLSSFYLTSILPFLFEDTHTWVQILALSLSCFASLGNLHNLPKLQYSFLICKRIIIPTTHIYTYMPTHVDTYIYA